MTEIQLRRNDIAPAVMTLLATFHQDTWFKLELAPTDSAPLCQRADGSLYEVGEDGWPMDYDDLDNDDAITINPTRVEVTEAGPSGTDGTHTTGSVFRQLP